MNITKSLSSLALVAVLGVSLSACGSNKDVTPAADATKSDSPVSAPTAAPIAKSTPTPTPDSKKSVRGNLIGNFGDIGTISDPATKTVWTKFTVDSITPITCDQQYSRASENGQLVTVDMTLETTPELAQSSFPKFDISAHDFKFIADNGTTYTGNLSTVATYSCIADNLMFPSAGMGPAEKLTGKVVLDLPAAHGILVMNTSYTGPGFEYKF
jgi:hypothetical protein